MLVQIHPHDNVAVAVAPITRGSALTLHGSPFTPTEDIPAGHKMAITAIAQGAPVIKYGYPIGTATQAIAPGSWVHSHNLRTALQDSSETRYIPAASPPLPAAEPLFFDGYLRADGRAGIRNEIWILPTVGCVNDVCTQLAARTDALARQSGLDGVRAFPHPYGCSQLGEDHAATRRILAALARHPNAGGVLVVGLGCENNTIEGFQQELGRWEENHTCFLECQQEQDELAAGQALLSRLIENAATRTRRPLPLSKLVVGLKCGGSDGLSGITANPLAGAFSDLLIAQGGSAILTEVPEMFGAEEALFGRCLSREIFDKAVHMAEEFRRYYVAHGQPVYENPSPGNKAGGITTLEEKSLGCIQKGGHAPVADVIAYGEAVKSPGLTLLSGPGNDLVSATALSAAGAQLILFTTGRGTPFGAPAVTLKIASNSALATKKPQWIDFDAGGIATGEALEKTAHHLMNTVLDIVSGRANSRAEQNGYGGIAIFKNGVTL